MKILSSKRILQTNYQIRYPRYEERGEKKEWKRRKVIKLESYLIVYINVVINFSIEFQNKNDLN